MRFYCCCCTKQLVRGQNPSRNDPRITKAEGAKHAVGGHTDTRRLAYCGYCAEELDEDGLFPEERAQVEAQSACSCSISTGIHESLDADGSPQKPWGLSFGSGDLDDFGYWEIPCAHCARQHEQMDGVPVGSYWPFPKGG